jgi:hypothetical protein
LDKLGALQPLFLPLGYQLAALPFCVLLASALSLEASATPLGGNAVAGTSAAQIAIAASGGAHIAEFGARQTNISNNSPAGHPDTTATAETGAPPEANSAEQNLAATVSADQKFEKDEINLAEKEVARAQKIAVDASGGFQ